MRERVWGWLNSSSPSHSRDDSAGAALEAMALRTHSVSVSECTVPQDPVPTVSGQPTSDSPLVASQPACRGQECCSLGESVARGTLSSSPGAGKGREGEARAAAASPEAGASGSHKGASGSLDGVMGFIVNTPTTSKACAEARHAACKAVGVQVCELAQPTGSSAPGQTSRQSAAPDIPPGLTTERKVAEF